MPDARSLPDGELTYTTSKGKRESQTVLHLHGPITLSNLFTFQEDLRSLKPPCLLLDLTGVPYMDSAGLGVLLNAYVSAQRAGRHFVLVGVCDRVMTLFTLTRVDTILTMFPTLPAAFASLLV